MPERSALGPCLHLLSVGVSFRYLWPKRVATVHVPGHTGCVLRYAKEDGLPRHF